MIREKNIVIFDIDGTMSIVSDRLDYLKQEPKDWDSFYENCDKDTPSIEMFELMSSLIVKDYDIYFCTGRPESVREKTRAWLQTHDEIINSSCAYNEWYDINLLMRKTDDKRPDHEVKPELLKEAGIDLDKIAFIVEDRKSMVDKWRELGILCLQCAEGDF